jgi:hypothetical protein
VLADAATSCVLHAELDIPKPGRADIGQTVAVWALCRDHLKPGQTVVREAFFTAPALALKLYEQLGVCMVGTLRVNRKGFPSDGPGFRTKKHAGMERGEYVAVRKGPVGLHRWLDTDGMCCLLSTRRHAAGPPVVLQRRVKGQAQRLSVPGPPVARDYNAKMGGWTGSTTCARTTRWPRGCGTASGGTRYSCGCWT